MLEKKKVYFIIGEVVLGLIITFVFRQPLLGFLLTLAMIMLTAGLKIDNGK